MVDLGYYSIFNSPMSRPIIFGEIEGISEGHHFGDRKEMMPSSFHRKWGSGIDGNASDGTAAIVLSGGYEDDQDFGDEIIYTGAGGRETGSTIQSEDQSWENAGNAGLLKCMNEGLPVRVIRGASHKSPYSPRTGYEYSGLYSVIEAWEEVGKSGFKICRFKLVYSGNNSYRRHGAQLELDHSIREKRSEYATLLRVVRDSKLSLDIKRLYDFKCQVCGFVIKVKSGFYAEGAHIKPIGAPHNGDDSLANLLCLCPNHHVMFDKGSFTIADDLTLIGDETGQLRVHQQHKINKDNLSYHRKSHGYD
jgi:putative restriction endonuclease